MHMSWLVIFVVFRYVPQHYHHYIISIVYLVLSNNTSLSSHIYWIIGVHAIRGWTVLPAEPIQYASNKTDQSKMDWPCHPSRWCSNNQYLRGQCDIHLSSSESPCWKKLNWNCRGMCGAPTYTSANNVRVWIFHTTNWKLVVCAIDLFCVAFGSDGFNGCGSCTSGGASMLHPRSRRPQNSNVNNFWTATAIITQ